MLGATNRSALDMVGDKNSHFGLTDIDRKALIEGKLAPKIKEIDKIKDSISFNDKKIEAYNKLSSLLQTFQATANNLRGAINNSDGNSNVFSATIVSATCTNGVTASSYIRFNTATGAQAGSFNLFVQQIAKAQIEQSLAFSSTNTSVTNDPSSSVSGQFNAGTFQINGVDITLAVGDNLSTIVAKINAKKSTTNITASIIKPTSGSYRVLLQSNLTGIENAYTISDQNNVLNNVFTQDPANNPTPTVQAAQDAIMIYNNLSVSRPLNIISDFIDNITFTLVQPNNTGDIIQVDIEPDTTQISNAIQDFVDSYNEIRMFAQQQKFRDKDGKHLPSTTLANDSMLNAITNNFDSFINSPVLGLTNYAGLGTIGITFYNLPDKIDNHPVKYSNLLKIDFETLNSLLLTNIQDINNLFAFNFTSSSPDLTMGIKRGDSLNVNSLTFDININRTTTDSNGNTIPDIVHVIYTPPVTSPAVPTPVIISAQFTPSNSADFTQGGTITGVTGTILENYEFSYSGTGVETINVFLTQGIADQIYNYIQQIYTNKLLSNTEEIVTQSNINLAENLSRKTTALESAREVLLMKEASLGKIRIKAEMDKEFLDAQQAQFIRRR